MSQFPRNTPNAFGPGTLYRSMELHEIGADGITATLNGTAYAVTGRGLLIDRIWYTTFIDAGGPTGRTAAAWGGKLPSDYKAGTDIQVRLISTTNATTGTMSWDVGLAVDDGTNLDDEAATTYNTITDAVQGSGFIWHYSALSTFTGTNLTPNQDIAIVAARDSSADGVVSDNYIKSIIIYYEAETDSNDVTDSNFKSMMTTLRKHYTEINFEAGDMLDTSGTLLTGGTYNSVICVAAPTGLINDIWETVNFLDATNNVVPISFHIPIDYMAGEDITVEVDWVPSSTSTGNVAWGSGLNINGLDGQAYSNEAATQYLSVQTVAGPGVVNEIVTTSFTFDCSTMVADSIAIFNLHRDENGGSDTFVGDARVLTLRVKIPRNVNGVTSVT